jgi:hypothetical protein
VRKFLSVEQIETKGHQQPQKGRAQGADHADLAAGTEGTAGRYRCPQPAEPGPGAAGRAGEREARGVTPPRRRWLSYSTGALPSGPEALGEPLAAFPSWFLRITCERCGKERPVSETAIVTTTDR